MQDISIGESGEDTAREKLPSAPVDVPFDVPISTTDAPTTGPVASSTVPLTV